MKLFLSYLRLIRPFNLLMIIFTLYMVRLFFLLSGSGQHNFHIQVSGFTYALFSLAFVFMAAGGYIINDYYDVEIDKVNKPNRVVIGKTISAGSAIGTYWLINICGILAGFFSCYCAGVPILGLLFLFYLVGLWFYSYKLKSTFLFGNILVSIFLALVPLGGAYIELYANTHSIAVIYDKNAIAFIWQLMGGISLFAFLSALIREIVKDVEDMGGDTLAGCRTMAIVIGIKRTKWVVFFLLVSLNVLLGYLQYQCTNLGIYLLIYFLLFIQAPLLFIFWILRKASDNRGFHKISTWLKILMVTGIIYVFGLAFEAYGIYLFFNTLFK